MSGMVSHVNGMWCLPIICFSHELGENYRIARLSTKSKNGVVGIGRPPCSVCGLTMRSAAGASKFYLFRGGASFVHVFLPKREPSLLLSPF